MCQFILRELLLLLPIIIMEACLTIEILFWVHPLELQNREGFSVHISAPLSKSLMVIMIEEARFQQLAEDPRY